MAAGGEGLEGEEWILKSVGEIKALGLGLWMIHWDKTEGGTCHHPNNIHSIPIPFNLFCVCPTAYSRITLFWGKGLGKGRPMQKKKTQNDWTNPEGQLEGNGDGGREYGWIEERAKKAKAKNMQK
jgi:hypothetical protein